VVDDRVPGQIESCGKGYFGDGHANAVGQSLTQWTGGSFDARGLAIFGMAWRATAPLAESLQFIERQIKAGDVKQSVQECTSMAG